VPESCGCCPGCAARIAELLALTEQLAEHLARASESLRLVAERNGPQRAEAEGLTAERTA